MARPGRKCGVCHHPEHARIDLHLARRVPMKVIAQRFGITERQVWWHKKSHLDGSIMAALLAAERVPGPVDLETLRQSESESYLQNLVAHRARLFSLADIAEEAGDFRGASGIHGRIIELWKVEGEILGELNAHAHRVVNNILVAPAYVELRIGLLEALRAFPEARAAVARVMHGVEAKLIEAKADAPVAAA